MDTEDEDSSSSNWPIIANYHHWNGMQIPWNSILSLAT
jgi:hypothetical protein